MYDLFNRKLKEFADELVSIYPRENDFKIFQTALCGILMIDKKMPQNYFDTYVVIPFEHKITIKDENFFLQKQEYDHSDLDIVSRLKNVWGNMNSENKAAIWKYMQVLVYICKQCR